MAKPSRALGDRPSPILVKEFRQGVRGYLFTGSFLILHALMLLVTALTLITPAEAAGAATAMFWTLVVVLIGVLMPLIGLQAVSSETALKALEPMLLTRLSPRAIVFGKWASLTAQNTILVVSLAPYFLLRYFLGGLQIVHELSGVAALWAGAAMLTAVSVSISAFRMHAVFRWLASFPLVSMAATLVFSFFASVAWTPGAWSMTAPLTAAALCLLTMVVMLEAGAWQIAPAADRSSALARAAVLAWLPVAVAALETLPARLRVQPALWTGLLVLLVIIGSLSEPQSAIPSVYARFFGRGPLRRLAGWFFAPGWASAVPFAVVATVATCLALQSAKADLANHEVVLATLAQVLLPLPLLPHVSFPRLPQAAWYLLMQVASFGVGVMAPVAGQVDSEGVAQAFAWFLPLCPIVALAVESETPELTPVAVDVLSALVALLVIAIALVQGARGLRQAERLVRDRRARNAAPAEPAIEEAQVERVAGL